MKSCLACLLLNRLNRLNHLNNPYRFRDYWHNTAVVRGGILVYNTGRALASFEQLLRDKAHCMAQPDALISAVGTKVWTCTLPSFPHISK